MTSSLHIVVGAGATGTATAKLLASMGAQVKVVTRSGSGIDAPGIELVAADASDQQELARIARGADAIYNCANPVYNKWTTDWPPLAASLLGAAETTEAVLVTLSNLYMYANPTRPMLATDPLNPSSVKGAVRADMWRGALASHAAGRARVTEARASDFIGPGIGKTAHMGDRVVPRVLKGKTVSLLGDLDAEHSWTALSDVARTLVTLGTNEQAWGHAWHVPTAPPVSQRNLVHRMCELADIEPVKVSVVPKLILRAAGLVSPIMREFHEVAYQFDAPFVIYSAATTRAFDLAPTPLDDTLRETLSSYGHARGSDLHVPG